jgi:PAS domain S-box-containing protein
MQSGIRVLLVDDDPSLTDLTSTYLERINENLDTHAVTDPEDALEYVRETRTVDCIVSDYNMPEMNGLELFDRIRDVDPDVPFILFTGKGSEEIASDAISRGVTDYLQKGTGTDQYQVLANRVENAVAKYQAERQAAETNQQLGQIIDRISDAFFAVDRDWTVEFINDQAASFIGEQPTDIVGTDLRESVPPDEAEDFYEVYEEALETQESVTYQGESVLRPGTWIENRVFPSENGLSVYFRDVTDRVKMEQQLKETNEKITALHDVATEANACSSEAEIYDLAIEAAEEILEFDLCSIDKAEDGHLVPQSVSKGLPSDGVYYTTSLDVADTLGAKTYRDGTTYYARDLHDEGYSPAESEYRSCLSVPVGDYGVFQAASSEADYFSDRDLELAELLISHVAVALDSMEYERELRAQRDRFATLFENIPHAVAIDGIEDGQQTVKRLNPTFESVFGVDGDEVVGEHLDEYIVPDDSEAEASALNEQILDGTDISGAELRREADDGLRDFLLHTFTTDDPTEDVFAIYTDITEQKHRERELERKNERLEEFAAVLSHDLQNPLNVAYGHLDLLEDACDCPDADCEQIRTALDRMDTLIDDVLTLARKGERGTDTEMVAIEDAVEQAWQTVQVDAGRLEIVDDLGSVEADPSHLREVLENLFGNAVTHAGDDVTVRVGPLSGGEDGFYVEDDGPGIPERDREAVFDRGYTTEPDGTGFGLAIVDAIVDAQNCDVRVTDAEHAATGARFEITGEDRADPFDDPDYRAVENRL